MNFELARPPAHAMIESLRGVGYTIQTAVADVIDNSISAKARNIWLQFRFAGDRSWIAIRDDGVGMSEDELRTAMTLGARNPLDRRDAEDLGRFGYGLKTASFSQCRNLTVASKKDGKVSVRRWDLDYIARPEVNEWRLLAEPEKHALPHIEILADSGTVVFWDRLDRITAGLKEGDKRSEDKFYEIIDQIEAHLAMVFHHFLEGPAPDVRISIIDGAGASRRIRPWDPFMSAHHATYHSPTERIKSPDGSGFVELQGFVLPHKDQLDDKAALEGAGLKGWTSQQGFYVYRNRRMLVAGSWLGLGYPRVWTSEEPFKLARLSLEFTNDADVDWQIDIKKSVARPPYWASHRIISLAERIRDRARRVFAHRGQYGKRAAVQDLEPAWTAEKTSSGTRYRINRKHPAVAHALRIDSSIPPTVNICLRILEETVPIQRIWLDTVESGETQTDISAEEPTAELVTMAQQMFSHFRFDLGFDDETARARLLATDPFHNFPEVVAGLTIKASRS